MRSPSGKGPLCVLVAGLLATAGCGEQAAGPPERLRIAIESAVSTLDPRLTADANSSRVAGLVHCSLAEPDGGGGWTGDLAASWRQVDPRTWEFELRTGAAFHDGSPVRAADVVATYRSVLDAASGSPKRAALPSVTGVEAAGEGRVRFHLSGEDAAFLEGTTLGILPARLVATPRLEMHDIVGCGPYRIGSIADDGLVVTAFARWHGGVVSLPGIEWRVIPDTVMRTLQLRSGDIDLVQNALEPDAVRHLRGDANLSVSVTPYDAFQYLGINHRHAALADVRVRRAIAHAIDREAIVRHVLAGQAVTASGLLPPHHAFHSPGGRRYGHDPAAARRLLDEAGLRDPDGDGPLPRLRLRYTTSTVELRRRIAEVIAADLAEVGIELSIESYEWATFFEDIARGDYDLYSLAWIGIRDPDLLRVVFHSAMTPPAGSNRGFFRSERLDRLTERGRREGDPERRRAVYARVQRLVARTLPYVPLWWPKNVVVRTTRLEGFEPHPAGDLGGLARAPLR
ncbi:MAG: ABC transporter substrate-binding protein [Candidatus Binatia bacterium]